MFYKMVTGYTVNGYPNKLSGTVGYLFRNKSFHPNTLKNQRDINLKNKYEQNHP
jgi:hypothetical protein